MQLTEEEAVEVKKWVVKRLEDISDADSDVLADYVLALIRSEAPDDEIRKASVENLEDFLREHTVGFVDELFATFGPKTVAAPGISHMQTQPLIAPGIPQSENFSQQTLQYSPRSSQQRVGYTAAISAQGGYESGGFNSRKRTFHEGFQQESSERDDTAHNNRSFKALRRSRGSGNGGRGDWSGRDGWRASNVPEAQPFSAPVGLGFPPMMPPPFPPLDQNDPMAAMMLLQNMGFPQMPGMPPLPIQNSAVPPTMDQRQRDQAGKSTERCPFYETQGICYLGAACPYQHGSQTKNGDEYDPKTANIVLDIDRPSGGFSNGNFGGSSMRGGHERGRGRGRGGSDRGGFGSRGGRGRSEFSLPGPNEDQSITTIVVEQIPEDKFDENTVREFFAQYGDIDEITLQPHKRLALIKYNSYDAAKRAWSSPKVIFDNRFVKVYWHRPPRKSERNGDHQRSSSATRVESDGSPFNKEEFERQQEEAQKAYEEKMKKRKETEEAKQMLERQRDELLKKQEEERIRLMQRLAGKSDSTGNDTSSEQRAESTRHTNGEAHHGGETGTTGENVSEQTKQLRAQLAALEAEAKSLGIDPASSRFSHGAPTHGNGGYRGFHTGYATAYRGRGAFSSRGRAGYDPSYRGRGSFHGRGRGGSGSGGVLRLDNRPRRVAISGIEFDTEKDEALRQYLIGIGEYNSIIPNPDRQDSLIVSFKERYIAEKLMFGPRFIPSVGTVELSWVPNLPDSAAASYASSSLSLPSGLGEASLGAGNAGKPIAAPTSGGQRGKANIPSTSGTSVDDDLGARFEPDVSHSERRDGAAQTHQNEVDYDVAEEDDRWGS